MCRAGGDTREETLPASPLAKLGREQNNLITQPLHSLKVHRIYSYKLILNRLYFFLLKVSSPNCPISLSSAVARVSFCSVALLFWLSPSRPRASSDGCGTLGATRPVVLEGEEEEDGQLLPVLIAA